MFDLGLRTRSVNYILYMCTVPPAGSRCLQYLYIVGVTESVVLCEQIPTTSVMSLYQDKEEKTRFYSVVLVMDLGHGSCMFQQCLNNS